MIREKLHLFTIISAFFEVQQRGLQLLVKKPKMAAMTAAQKLPSFFIKMVRALILPPALCGRPCHSQSNVADTLRSVTWVFYVIL